MAGTPIPMHPKNTQKNIYLKYIEELGRAGFLRFENLDSVKYSNVDVMLEEDGKYDSTNSFWGSYNL
jgi:hypothetical protein